MSAGLVALDCVEAAGPSLIGVMGPESNRCDTPRLWGEAIVRGEEDMAASMTGGYGCASDVARAEDKAMLGTSTKNCGTPARSNVNIVS